MKGTVCWCKVFLMTLIADWNLKGLHTRPDGQNSHPLICRGFRAAHWSDREKWGGGLLTLLEFDCTISANSLYVLKCLYIQHARKKGLALNETRAESISSASRHTISSCCSLVRVWSTLRAQFSEQEFTEPFTLCYRREGKLHWHTGWGLCNVVISAT